MRSRTRFGVRGAGALAVVGAVSAALAAPATADSSAGWQPDLPAGTGAGVVVQDGVARFDPATAHRLPVHDGPSTEDPSGTEGTRTEGSPDAEADAMAPTGFLTLPARTLDQPTEEVSSTLDVQIGPGSAAVLDVRGRRSGGGWTEWIPSTPGADPGSGTARLPEDVREIQSRLVLTAAGDDRPAVRRVTLSASVSTGDRPARPEAAPLHYPVFATREGLVGGTTANGHRIGDRDRFVALPSRRALSADGRSDYSVRVCAPNGRCAFAPVWDIGPWNVKDDYWNPSNQREMFKDLPQGVPQAQAAVLNGHNGGKDGFGRRPANPAGIDLGDGIFWDALGLKDNSPVSVDYLWTGSGRLSKVDVEGAPDVALHSAPDPDAPVVGVAVDTADVSVRCRLDGWLMVGERQYLPASAVPDAATAPTCPAGDPPGTATDPTADRPTADTPTATGPDGAGRRAADRAGTGPGTTPRDPSPRTTPAPDERRPRSTPGAGAFSSGSGSPGPSGPSSPGPGPSEPRSTAGLPGPTSSEAT